MKSCVHIYCGDGKGKTTAAVGLAVRFAGHGGKVMIAQFLKDGSSSEINVLEKIDGIKVISCTKKTKFSFQMNDEEKREAAVLYNQYFDEVTSAAVNENAGLLILDEIMAAYNNSFVDHDKVIAFLKNRPENLEVVLTGRNPATELIELADYVSESCKIKHPFDEGITAREGIEF